MVSLPYCARGNPTVCVTRAGAGVNSVWEQRKLEARKILAAGAAESPAPSERFVSPRKLILDAIAI